MAGRLSNPGIFDAGANWRMRKRANWQKVAKPGDVDCVQPGIPPPKQLTGPLNVNFLFTRPVWRTTQRWAAPVTLLLGRQS